MSNTARKARKREGVKFERTPKVGTPYLERRENLPRDIWGNPRASRPTRFGRTAAVTRRLESLGLTSKPAKR